MADHLFDEYTRYSPERLKELGVSDEAWTLLVTTGLPTWCAPNAYFGPVGDTENELPLLQVGTARYVGLGEDRDDNVIAFDLRSYEVWVLVAQGSPIYFASDLKELSFSLHEFQRCIDSAVEADAQAFVQNRIPISRLESFVSWAKLVNSRLVRQGTFWGNELVRLGIPNQSLEPSLAT